MNYIIEKAQILTEALPYIQKFRNKIIVVKYGGSIMVDEALKEKVIKDIVLLKSVGLRPIIVHGGGKDISNWLLKIGKEPKFIKGLRVTDKETMEVAEMVLAGKINKNIVQMIQGLGANAVGISGKDGGMLTVDRIIQADDLGYVGEIKKVDISLLQTLLEKDFIPVIASIGLDQQFETYNINADDAACAIAASVQAEKLVFLTDIEGVLQDPSDKKSLISELTLDKAKALLISGVVGGGMLPKLKNCIEAVENDVGRVHILDGRLEHSLLLEIFTNKGIGTVIIQ